MQRISLKGPLQRKNYGIIRNKQNPDEEDNMVIHRTLSPERKTFQIGTSKNPTCESFHDKAKTASHISRECKA